MTKQTKKHTIDRSSAIPLYKQIKDILILELRASEGDTGKPFSTEQELVERFRVSRAPVRQALKELANEGYVYRERAKGTFPVQELPVRPLGLELGGLVGFLRQQGIECNSKIIGLDRVFPPENLCSILRLNPSDTVLRISRLILLKEKPLVWTQTYLFVPDDFHPSAQELEESESVFVLLQSDQGTYVARGDHQIYASGATSEDAEILDLEVGEPVLVMETKLYTRNDQAIGWRRAVHRADEYKLSFTVNR
ncbi:GntR family transcriptional regulator [Lysinibacillus sp. SGAir0095]|uniref:GntR family transcriptional regulator n=1 Tax=Lysinibacillus sp. SGAir0095 TaxID=2070463 RepID=UPI0010CCF183|nr:GntR family transcriptional regulator [Lysinibacillus sp. SGAir0095]QCR32117.1 GntR family transcriptional regulator [Lysinibacillus sp. SGAir0095]